MAWGLFIIVSLTLFLSFGESKVYAESFSSGSGSEQDPYIITTAEQLNSIRDSHDHLSAHYRLESDIDLQASYPNWTPIGTLATADRFRGSFDGNGHTISGLTIKQPAGQYLGLFASIHITGKVHDLTLSDVDITGVSYVGAVAGINRGEIGNVHVTGNINGSSRFVGGIVGRSTSNSSLIIASSFSGKVSGQETVGGIVGENSAASYIVAATSSGEVISDAESGMDIGGLTGFNSGVILYGYADMKVSAKGKNAENIGGLVGYNSYYMIDTTTSSNGRIAFSYASGTVAGGSSVGGLVGYNQGEIENSFSTSDVESSYRSLFGNNGYVGGFVGLNQGYGYSHNNNPYTYDGGMITHSYATGMIQAPYLNASTIGSFVGENEKEISNSFSLSSKGSFAGTGSGQEPVASRALGDSESFLRKTYDQWDFENIWAIEDGETTPHLRMFLSASAELIGLDVEPAIDVQFDSENLQYTVVVPHNLQQAELQLLKQLYAEVVVKKNEHVLTGTNNHYQIMLDSDVTTINVEARSPDGINNLTYTVSITRTTEAHNVDFNVNGGLPIDSQTVFHYDTAVMPADPIKEGYLFAGWYLDQDTYNQPFDVERTPITGDTVLYAKWELKTALTLSIHSSGGAVQGNELTYAYGTEVELIAIDDEGYRFAGWVDAVTGKRLSLQAIYSFKITDDTQLIASFVQDDTESYIVSFVSESGMIISVQQVARGDNAIPPAAPSKPDTAFVGWNADYNNIQSDLTLRPVYSANGVTYNVTVIDGSIAGGITEYEFDTFVSVTADPPSNGLVFSHWEMNGSIVSYSEIYFFYVTGHVTVIAIFDEVSMFKSPRVSISPDVIVNATAGKISFIGQIQSASSDFTLIECGLVVKQSAQPINELHFGTAGAIRAKSNVQTLTGQFMMNKTGVQAGETWYAVAYLIYQDNEGHIVTKYSDVTSGTMT